MSVSWTHSIYVIHMSRCEKISQLSVAQSNTVPNRGSSPMARSWRPAMTTMNPTIDLVRLVGRLGTTNIATETSSVNPAIKASSTAESSDIPM